jgi:hypothetical protein
MIVLPLTHAELHVDPVRREVDTVFRDGLVQGAQRQFSAEDIATAAELGYEPTEAGVWRSLVAHELDHSLISEWLWDQPSEVLRHYCAGEHCPYYQRLYVEGMVLALERYVQTGEVGDALIDIPADDRRWWRREASILLTIATRER